MNLDPYLILYTKSNWKWIQDLNVRAKTIKILEGNIGQKLHNTEMGNDFLDMTPRAYETKDKLGFMKI